MTSPTHQPSPAHPSFPLLISSHHHFPHGNMHTCSPAFTSRCSWAGGRSPPWCCLETRGVMRTESPQDLPHCRPAEHHHLLPKVMGHLTNGLCWAVNWERDAACGESPEDGHKYEGGQLGSDQIGLHLEKSLTWSLAASGRLSLAWHASGQGCHIAAHHGPAACLLSSITKEQEMGLGRGCHSPSAALVLKHPCRRAYLHSSRRTGHPWWVLGTQP